MAINFPASLLLSCRIVLSKIEVSLSQPLLCRDCQSEKLHHCSATKGKTAYRLWTHWTQGRGKEGWTQWRLIWLGSLKHTRCLLLGFAV